MDFFGPIFVNVGRHKEKLWGVIFTRLTLRAVHIEIAHSLDTSSCVMCLANFMSRRGTPKQIFSDNGTNFKATEKIVKEELKNVELDKLVLKYDKIKWRFNPPAAPHMGGAWERFIRSIKMVLKPISPNAFAMHRVGEILETTNAGQWHWVPTKLNVADMATKFISKPNSQEWINGPSFLQQSKDQWSKQPTLCPSNKVDHDEIKKTVLIMRKESIVVVPFLIGSAYTEQRQLFLYTWTFYELDAKLRNSKKFLL